MAKLVKRTKKAESVTLTKEELKDLKELSGGYKKHKQEQSTLEADINKASERTKYWDELTLEEKIERTRLNVKNIDARLAESLTRLNELRGEIDTFFDHSHEEDGRVVIKISKEQRYRLQNRFGGLMAAEKAAHINNVEVRKYF